MVLAQKCIITGEVVVEARVVHRPAILRRGIWASPPTTTIARVQWVNPCAITGDYETVLHGSVVQITRFLHSTQLVGKRGPTMREEKSYAFDL